MGRPKPIAAVDCETDPFLFDRKPEPFLWGFYDGELFRKFSKTAEFVDYIIGRDIILYAHNGGKFDFMFLLPYIKQTKAQIINGRIVSMMLGKAELRDSFSIIPVPLRDLGGKKEIDYAKLERSVRRQHMPEIIEYLTADCVSLYNAVVAYRTAAGRYKTIASNALAFCKKLGVDPGKNNYRFDVAFRPFYYGGRTECFQPGTHKNLVLLDIRSAYPFAMTHEHATGSQIDFVCQDDFSGMTKEQIQRSFIELECEAKGCFPLRTNGPQGLIFPHEYNEFKITGWEYIAAKELGLISNEKILSVRHSSKTIHFREYVKYWYDYKLKHAAKDKDGNRIDPTNYTIGKTMQNSLYGKLAQDPARYFDYKIMPAGSPLPCFNYAEPIKNRMLQQRQKKLSRQQSFAPFKPTKGNVEKCANCGLKADDHGWTLEHEYDKHEIHRRESLWKWQHNDGENWIARKLYKNVATGASITGFTRAHLLRAMHSLGISSVIYCDTDGIVCKANANLSGISLTENVGDWEIEDHDCPEGHFAGKKLYGIVKSNGKHKLASKGAKLTFAEIERISNGEIVTWRNDAPTFDLAGNAEFIVRDIRSTARQRALTK